MKQRLNIVYAPGGPGDVIGTYREWKQGRDDARGEVSVAFSSQFYDLCRSLDAHAHVISPHARKETLVDGRFVVEHRPKPSWATRGAFCYFMAEIVHTLGMVWTCLRFHADVAVVSDCMLWAVWVPARILGVRIVAVLHCTFWPAGFRPSGRGAKSWQWITGWFWRRCVDATLVVSPECERQIRTLAPRLRTPVVVGLSYFRHVFFDAVPSPPEDAVPFRVMFAGRVARNKGVFDVVEMAARLEEETPGRFSWEMCGTGDDIEELRETIDRRGLTTVMRLMGKLNPDEMRRAYGRSHAVVVPTTSGFPEGLCQVAAEAVLAGRPVVASRVVPALDFIGEAVVEVPPDDVTAYTDAIRRLAENRELYAQKQKACANVAAPFFDRGQSWGQKLEMLLKELTPASVHGGGV